jgi:hypothetical protein
VEEVAFTWRSDADGAAHWLSPRKKKPGASADDLSQCLFTFGGRARAGARKAIAKTLISVHMSPEATGSQACPSLLTCDHQLCCNFYDSH